jgi:hypothetical protein
MAKPREVVDEKYHSNGDLGGFNPAPAGRRGAFSPGGKVDAGLHYHEFRENIIREEILLQK